METSVPAEAFPSEWWERIVPLTRGQTDVVMVGLTHLRVVGSMEISVMLLSPAVSTV
jgi:hypothetical protein